MSGLKPRIRRRVRTFNPQSWMQMMRLAKDVEEELCGEDEDGWRLYARGKGRSNGGGPNQSYRTLNSAHKDLNNSSGLGWSGPRPESTSNKYACSSMALMGIKSDDERRSGFSEQLKGFKHLPCPD